jgi:hypothetical protein
MLIRYQSTGKKVALHNTKVNTDSFFILNKHFLFIQATFGDDDNENI